VKLPKIDFFLEPFKELYFIFTYPVVSKFYTPKKTILPSETKGTLVIVECWFQKNAYHSFWKSYLEKKGFKTELLSFTNMNEDFSSTAGKLADLIKRKGLENFTLVGISAGALLCLYYLNNYDSWKKTNVFISIAGPLHGAWMALFISFTKKGRDLIPKSKFLMGLLSQEIPVNKMVTLSAAVDELVPLESSVIEGVPSYTIKAYGHNFFHLDHKETYDLIANLSVRYSSSSKI